MEDRIDEGLERVTDDAEDAVEGHRQSVGANDTPGDDFEDDVEAHRQSTSQRVE